MKASFSVSTSGQNLTLCTIFAQTSTKSDYKFCIPKFHFLYYILIDDAGLYSTTNLLENEDFSIIMFCMRIHKCLPLN